MNGDLATHEREAKRTRRGKADESKTCAAKRCRELVRGGKVARPAKAYVHVVTWETRRSVRLSRARRTKALRVRSKRGLSRDHARTGLGATGRGPSPMGRVSLNERDRSVRGSAHRSSGQRKHGQTTPPTRSVSPPKRPRRRENAMVSATQGRKPMTTAEALKARVLVDGRDGMQTLAGHTMVRAHGNAARQVRGQRSLARKKLFAH